jgi:6-phosphogluconolactonase
MVTTLSAKNKDKLIQLAIDIIACSVADLLKTQAEVVLAIPGGRSIQGIFKALAEKENIGKLPWGKVQIFMVDERLVPINHRDSNFGLAKEVFLGKLTGQGVLPPKNLHPFTMDKRKEDLGILAYEQELEQYGTGYDIVLLSAGEDGHIGALFPDHHSIYDDSEFYLSMNDAPKPPRNRMTLSRRMLLRSGTAILLFLGKAKKDAYKRFLNSRLDYQSCPAKLALWIDNLYVITDLG